MPAVNLVSDFCNISDPLKAVLKRKFFSPLFFFFCKIRRYNQGIIYFKTERIIHYQIQVFFIVILKTFCSKCVTGWRTGFKSLNLFQNHREWFSGKERLYITFGSSPRFVCLT